MRATGKLAWVFFLLAVSTSIIGCGNDGPKLATVGGTVTMDGKPLENATVAFYLDAGGRPGVGVTDSEGKYTLLFRGQTEGGIIGPNTVRISTHWPDGEPGDGEIETIPPKYNSQSTLKEEIVGGENIFNFDLTSEPVMKK